MHCRKGKKNGTITPKKADDVLNLISPPPGLPPSRGRSYYFPGGEGLREGDKMTFTFFWVIDPKKKGGLC
jgi:hypothetical protein